MHVDFSRFKYVSYQRLASRFVPPCICLVETGLRGCHCLPPTTEEVYGFVRAPEFVRLAVCVEGYSKTRAWIWMKCCVSTDVGTWTN